MEPNPGRIRSTPCDCTSYDVDAASAPLVPQWLAILGGHFGGGHNPTSPHCTVGVTTASDRPHAAREALSLIGLPALQSNPSSWLYRRHARCRLLSFHPRGQGEARVWRQLGETLVEGAGLQPGRGRPIINLRFRLDVLPHSNHPVERCW